MSLEAALEANTAAIYKLIATLAGDVIESVMPTKGGENAKKSDTSTTAAATSAPSGAQSVSIQTKSSDAPSSSTELFDWHEKTAGVYAELKNVAPSLDSAKKVILAINSKIGRAQAEAVLARFGAQAVSPKADKQGLDESQYPEFIKLGLQVLAGRVDATQSIPGIV